MTYHEKVGESNLRGITQYAHNIHQCRRVPLAEHFGEDWTPEMCSMKCDVCSPKPGRGTEVVDVTEMAKAVIDAIPVAQRKSKSGKCTAIQLLEAWIGKTKPKLGSLRIATREDCERILVEMLLAGHLKQIYQSAAYGFVSYFQQGPNAKNLMKNQASLEMSFEVVEKKNPVPKTGLSAKEIAALEKAEQEEKFLFEAEDNFIEEEQYDDVPQSLANDVQDVKGEERFPGKVQGEPECVDLEEDVPASLKNGGEKISKDVKPHIELDFGDLDDLPKGRFRDPFDVSSESPPKLKRTASQPDSGQKKRRGLF